jgi:glutaredoxin
MDYIVPSFSGFTIYTKSNCRFCSLVKELLNGESVLKATELPTVGEILSPLTVNCDAYLEENRDGFLQFIRAMTGKNHKTFPMVFFDGEFIGGYTETKVWYERMNAFSNLTDF